MFSSVPARLETPRLVLRFLVEDDASQLQAAAHNPRLAARLAQLPHPYTMAHAQDFVRITQENRVNETTLHYAICQKSTDTVIGITGILGPFDHGRGELGYWLGEDYWGQGLCTEAHVPLIPIAFDVLGLTALFATHSESNPASGRVLEKLGFRYVKGCVVDHRGTPKPSKYYQLDRPTP